VHPADPAGDAARNKVLLHGRAGEALVPVRPLVLSAFQKFFLLLVLQLQVQLHARDIGGVYFFGRAVAVVLELKRKGKAIAKGKAFTLKKKLQTLLKNEKKSSKMHKARSA